MKMFRVASIAQFGQVGGPKLPPLGLAKATSLVPAIGSCKNAGDRLQG